MKEKTEEKVGKEKEESGRSKVRHLHKAQVLVLCFPGCLVYQRMRPACPVEFHDA